MVAEPVVAPAGRGGHFQLTLDLPPRPDGPSRVSIGVQGNAPASTLRSRGADILGVVRLDAYLVIDGRMVHDESACLRELAGPGSKAVLRLRLRGGVNGSDGTDGAGSGQPSQLPLPLVPAAATSAAANTPFPHMVFDDPLSGRSPAQLTAFAETTRTFMDLLANRPTETNAKMESMGAVLHGETEGLRAQAGSVVHGLQEQATAVLSQMLSVPGP